MRLVSFDYILSLGVVLILLYIIAIHYYLSYYIF